MRTKAYLWIIGFFAVVTAMLVLIGYEVVKVDPFFHYHQPDLEGYYYSLDNQRSQNDGIIKHFDYDAIITGTSMTENFKVTTMDQLFGTTSVKVPFSGGSYKEINDNLAAAIAANPDLRIIVRGLDMMKFFDEKDTMREDLGEFPTYLYDDNIFNDVRYVFNRNVVFDRVYTMVRENDDKGFEPGITSFDAYSNWMSAFDFGMESVAENGVKYKKAGDPVHLTDEEREMILASVAQNITSLPKAHPEIEFYYFFPPYSAIWWKGLAEDGTIYKQIEAERLIIEEILQYDNIKLFSFNNMTDITTDINNYKDYTHYGIWISDLLLKLMKEDKGLLRKDNYEEYLDQELAFYTSFDYEMLNDQEDYESDYYAAALLDKQYYGVDPLDVSSDLLESAELKHAKLVDEQYNDSLGVECTGTLQRDADSEVLASEYILDHDYVGAKITIDDISDYRYLSFYGMKVKDHGQPGVFIYDENNTVLSKFAKSYKKTDGNWHHYVMDVTELEGKVSVIFNGGYVDKTGSDESQYIFSDIRLY